NFPVGPPGDPDDHVRKRPADISGKHSLDAGQCLALLGAGLLGVSVFMPFVIHFWSGDSPSLVAHEISHGLPLGTISLLGLALLSAFVALKRWYVFLWLSGFAAYMALALALLLNLYLYSLSVQPVVGDEPKFSPNGFSFH